MSSEVQWERGWHAEQAPYSTTPRESLDEEWQRAGEMQTDRSGLAGPDAAPILGQSVVAQRSCQPGSAFSSTQFPAILCLATRSSRHPRQQGRSTTPRGHAQRGVT